MAKKKRETPQGQIPDGKRGVYDDSGNLRGIVGPRATSVTAARMTGKGGARLTRKDGGDSWCFPK